MELYRESKEDSEALMLRQRCRSESHLLPAQAISTGGHSRVELHTSALMTGRIGANASNNMSRSNRPAGRVSLL